MGADVIFYEDANFEKIVHRINIAKVAKFSIAPNNAPYHILCYVPGNLCHVDVTLIHRLIKFIDKQII